MDISLKSIDIETLIKTLSKHVFVIFLISFAEVAFSSQVVGLYQADVIVSAQNDAERKEAFTLALDEVLVRVSGKRSVLENSVLIQSITQPEQLVQKFSYQALVSKDDKNISSVMLRTKQSTSAVSADLSNSYRLNIVFSRLAVNNILKKSGEPVWGGNRPSVLLWMATEKNGKRTVVNATDVTAISSALKQAAKIRGVPLYLPVMDLQDEASVASSDIWGLFINSLNKASSRYRADAVVVARLNQPSGANQWTGQWVFELKGIEYNGMMPSQSLDSVAVSLLGDIAESLAERYAILGGDISLNSELELEVSDIKTMEDYVAVTRYIESLPPVNTAQLLWAKGDRVRFFINLKGYLEQLEEHIELDTVLSAELLQSLDQTDGLRLHYRWSKLN